MLVMKMVVVDPQELAGVSDLTANLLTKGQQPEVLPKLQRKLNDSGNARLRCSMGRLTSVSRSDV
jgi:hypothetical protein